MEQQVVVQWTQTSSISNSCLVCSDTGKNSSHAFDKRSTISSFSTANAARRFVSKSLLHLLSAILNGPFCSGLSPTCQNDVQYGTQMQMFHFVAAMLMSCRNSRLNLYPWWPSRISKGGTSSNRSKTPILSTDF